KPAVATNESPAVPAQQAAVSITFRKLSLPAGFQLLLHGFPSGTVGQQSLPRFTFIGFDRARSWGQLSCREGPPVLA
ncbi:MAG: hypothetical protein OXH65_12830, partial [Paracoccaceae bacterium]|nr:hypothetical protein [Paracoccaceae bacterium]